jgi:adenosylmethionine-8-amino-7-oxononanoate aminotransferase
VMVAPPLIVNEEEVDTIARLIGETVGAFEKELRGSAGA